MKKVLVISYNWPPAGGIGVHRTLKAVKYFREYGWEPVVFTAENAHYPYLDEGNFKDIPDKVETLRVPIVEPFSLFKKLSGRKKNEALNNIIQVRSKKSRFTDVFGLWVRGNFFIPDARALWIRPSVTFLSKYLAKNKVDAIFSDGPPHTNTRIACILKRKFNIPWLADFQDPWTQVDYFPQLRLTAMARKIHERLEQAVFKNADKITIVSPTWKQDLECIGAKKVSVVYWGYDEDDFTDVEAEQSDKFVLFHAGLLGHDRQPDMLFEVLKELGDELSSFKEHLQLQLAGQVDVAVKDAIANNNLDVATQYLGYIARKDALQKTLGASILLLPLNKADNIKGRIPGKCFEIMRANKPVLAFGPEDSDVGKLLKQDNKGIAIPYDDKNAIKQFVKKCFEQFLTEGKTSTASNDINIAYSNQVLTGKFANYLNEMVSNG
jgi:glycosyltransferase involved in cell wall biosynthesis